MDDLFFYNPKRTKNKKIKIDFKKEIEPHEVILDSLAQKKEKELGLTEKKIEVPLLKRIIQLFFLCCVLIIIFLFIKTFQLQIIQGAEFNQLAEKNRFLVQQINAERGVIYDQKGEQLVYNKKTFDLVCDKNKLPTNQQEIESLFLFLGKIFNQSPVELINEISDKQFLIKNNLNHQELIVLKTKIDELTGCQIKENFIREYKEGEIFSHIIGYLGKISREEQKENPQYYNINDYVGRMGLEAYYEDVLRRNPGQLKIERDALGRIISQEIISPPEPGKNLVLWIDADLQRKITEELKIALENTGAKSGTAIALDPKTGGVLALVSLPSYNNNAFSGSEEEIKKILNDARRPLFNRAIAGTFSTGSTIKPLIAVGALEEGIISPEKQIYDGGVIEVPHKYNPEIIYYFRGIQPHGWVDMRKAIAVSSNIYFYTVGGGYKDQPGLGPSRIKKYLELFGWGRKTNIDLIGEAQGLVPDPNWKKEVKKENWWDGDTYHLSIGQGDLLVTPIQLAVAFNAIANGGVLYQPQIVQKVIDNEKNIIKDFTPIIINQNFVKPENLQVVKEGMRQAVLYGTATMLNSVPVAVASKTGTAETNLENHYNAWVAAFAPYEDPEILLVVMLEKIEGLRAAALPVAQKVLNWYFSQPPKVY